MTPAIRSFFDFSARLAFVGIFFLENVHHMSVFSNEVIGLVSPAVGMNVFYSSIFHGLSIFLGLIGSVGFILGSITGHATMMSRSISSLLIFLAMITFVWWVRREGVWLWDALDSKNRQIHLLKNMSIAGGLATVQSMLPVSKDVSVLSMLKRLFISTRPWSLPASLMPCLVVLSSLSLPVVSWSKFGFFIAGVVCLQAASNLFNSYADFSNQVDTKDNSGDRTIVDGYLNLNGCFYFGFLLCLSWMYCFWLCFFPTVHDEPAVYTMLGGAMAVFYSLGGLPLKYIGLGDAAVYAAFGPLLACTAVLAAGYGDWESQLRACIHSTPVTLLVVAILHANNIRDLKTDELAGANTVAVRLGRTAAIMYFDALVILPFLLLAALAKTYNNFGMCSAVVAIPQAWALTRRIRENPVHREIPEATAQTMVVFGLTQSIGAFAWTRCII